MGLVIVYIVIWSIVILISFTLVLVLARRFYMQRRYWLRDRERERYAGLAALLISGKPDIGELKKRPGTDAWIAIEEALLKAYDHKDSDKVFLRVLFNELGYTGYYIKKLAKGNRWEQAFSADRLGKIECREAVPALINALSSKYRDVRNLAVYSLGAIRDERALHHLVKMMKGAVMADEEMSIRILKSALISFKSILIPYLLPLTKDPEWRVRGAVMEILGEIGDPGVAGVFMAGINDGEQDVRAKAAKSLGKLKYQPAVPSLKKMLKDPFWVVRIHASRALGLIGDHSSIPDLVKLLTDRDWQVRKSSAEALARIGGDAYHAMLEFYLHTTDEYGRAQAAEELERAGIVVGLMNFLLNKENAYAEGRKRAEKVTLERKDLFKLRDTLERAGEGRLIEGLTSLAGKMFSQSEIKEAAYAASRG